MKVGVLAFEMQGYFSSRQLAKGAIQGPSTQKTLRHVRGLPKEATQEDIRSLFSNKVRCDELCDTQVVLKCPRLGDFCTASVILFSFIPLSLLPFLCAIVHSEHLNSFQRRLRRSHVIAVDGASMIHYYSMGTKIHVEGLHDVHITEWFGGVHWCLTNGSSWWSTNHSLMFPSNLCTTSTSHFYCICAGSHKRETQLHFQK